MAVEQVAQAVDQQAGVAATERNVAVASHLSALLGWAVPGVGHLLGPLAIWWLKGADSAFVRLHSLEALNFQISLTIYSALGMLLGMAAAIAAHSVAPVIIVFVAVGVIDTALIVRAALVASSGQAYRYPLTLRFFK